MGDEEGEVLADLDGDEGDGGASEGDDDEGDDEPAELPLDPALQRLPAHSEPARATSAAVRHEA
jgi:hypothetical protein